MRETGSWIIPVAFIVVDRSVVGNSGEPDLCCSALGNIEILIVAVISDDA